VSGLADVLRQSVRTVTGSTETAAALNSLH